MPQSDKSHCSKAHLLRTFKAESSGHRSSHSTVFAPASSLAVPDAKPSQCDLWLHNSKVGAVRKSTRVQDRNSHARRSNNSFKPTPLRGLAWAFALRYAQSRATFAARLNSGVRCAVKVSIRRAEQTDAKAMTPLACDLGFNGDEIQFGKNLENALSTPTVTVYVAESEPGKIVGWAAVEDRNIVQMGKTLEVTALVVKESARNLGIGRLLMQMIESDALKSGLPIIRLRSSLVRTSAHKFYQAIGYEVQKTQHCFIKRLHT